MCVCVMQEGTDEDAFVAAVRRTMGHAFESLTVQVADP